MDEQIINHYRFHKNNTIKEISIIFKMKEHEIHKIIDNFLKQKK